MRIKFITKYNVSFLPTPRHKKLRYREEVEEMYGEIKEVSELDLKPAFETENEEILQYEGRLWMKAVERDIHCGDKENPMMALDALIRSGITNSTYYGRYNYANGDTDESCREQRDDIVERLNSNMGRYLIVDGVLYKETSEPFYCIYVFGFGRNHGGIGTSLSTVNGYNPNISNRAYYNALEFEEAKEDALRTAIGRGDTDSVKYIESKTPIVVHDESLVKRNPKKDHVE